MKPGWKTTEFWTTSFAQILALLAFIGVLTPSESQTLGEALGKAVAAVFTLFVNGTVVIHYVQSRLALKASAGRAANGTASSGVTLPCGSPFCSCRCYSLQARTRVCERAG